MGVNDSYFPFQNPLYVGSGTFQPDVIGSELGCRIVENEMDVVEGCRIFVRILLLHGRMQSIPPVFKLVLSWKKSGNRIAIGRGHEVPKSILTRRYFDCLHKTAPRGEWRFVNSNASILPIAQKGQIQ